MGYLTRDAVFNDKINYSTSDKLLFDIRRYIRVVVAMQVIFVAIVVITFGLVWDQVSRYDVLKTENVNMINTYVVQSLGNVKSMTDLAVPIISNLQYASNGLVAAIAALYNATGVYTSVTVNRHLLSDAVTQEMLSDEDYKLRVMIYNQVHSILSSASQKVQTFDMSNVNLIMLGVAEQLHSVNFTGIAQRYDRTIADLEGAAHFGVLASAMLGAVSRVMNTTLPGIAEVTATMMTPFF